VAVYLAAFASLVLAGLSLGPSFAHVLEAPPRLSVWSPELWREATVFQGQFALFAKVGAPLDVASILVVFLLAYLLANERPAFWFALAGAVRSQPGWPHGSLSSHRPMRYWPPGNRVLSHRTLMPCACDGRPATWS
jgi:hypothetical protein